jgi:hypothetical protein
MRRLISTIAAGLLAGGTAALTGGIASAGTTVHHAPTGTTVRQAPTCVGGMPYGGSYYFNVAKNGVNYYLGAPRKPSPGAAAYLKPTENSSTSWALCESGSSSYWLLENGGLALTSRSSSPGADVTTETAGNGGAGFSSQQWFLNCPSTTCSFYNVKTGLFLRVHNNGPIMGQDVTTGSSAASWTYSP